MHSEVYFSYAAGMGKIKVTAESMFIRFVDIRTIFHQEPLLIDRVKSKDLNILGLTSFFPGEREIANSIGRMKINR